MRYTVCRSTVSVVGTIWMPAVTCAMDYDLSAYDVGNVQAIRDEFGCDWREAIERWLSTHAGDFQSVEDFSASLEVDGETVEVEWASGDSEFTADRILAGYKPAEVLGGVTLSG